MISLKASGADSNGVGASSFVGIPKPSGVSDGDIVVACIAVPGGAAVVVTPPDESWIAIQHTDPSRAISISVFWKVAINEPTNWVFGLSSSVQATGGVVVYARTDTYNAIEVIAAKLTASSASHGVPSITASVPGEEYVLVLAADTAGTYTAATGFQRQVTKTQVGSTIEIHRKQLQNAAQLAAFSSTFSLVANGAAVAIILRPDAGTLSLDEVRSRIVSALPDGVEDVYDLEPGGDYYKFYQAMAQTFKTFGYDQTDLLRQEIVPFLARYSLRDWEILFGLQTTLIAQTGTIPQRQARIIAAWRSAAGEGSSIPAISAALAPVLGYFPDTIVGIIETSRAALKTAHTYQGNDIGSLIWSPTSLRVLFDVNDFPMCSAGGVHVRLTFSHAAVQTIYAILTGPDGNGLPVDPIDYIPTLTPPIAYALWPLGFLGTGALVGATREFSQSVISFPQALTKTIKGSFITGRWSLAIVSTGAGTLTDARLFVEGVGRQNGYDGLGGAIFEWGVYLNPTHLGEAGYSPDLDLARRIVLNMQPAHTNGKLLQSLNPYPDVESGVHAAIPDECIPV